MPYKPVQQGRDLPQGPVDPDLSAEFKCDGIRVRANRGVHGFLGGTAAFALW